MGLKRNRINEVKPRKDKAQILCSGYLCPLAERCHRFVKAVDWHRSMVSQAGNPNTNVVFQSPTVNSNGKCVYFIQSATNDGKLR